MKFAAPFNILDRYIALELVAPFCFGIFLVIAIIIPTILMPLTDLIVKAGVSIGSVLLIILYNLPYVVVLAFPVAFLFATLLTISRMSKDFEIVAMRAAGVSLKRVIAPILIGALLVSGVDLAINEYLVPFANRQIQTLEQELLKSAARPPIKANTFFQGTDNRYFYVRDVDPDGTMRHVFIFDKTNQTGMPSVISAETARWNGNVLRLDFGSNYKYDREGFIEYVTGFKTMDIQVTLSNSAALPPGGLNFEAMSSKQLAGQLSDLQHNGGATRAVEMQLYKKWAVPLATFCAALIGAPLGLIFSRMGGYVGVAFSIILVFVWYVTMQITTAMGNYGQLPPFLAAWTGNLVFFTIGAVLVYRMDRR